MDLQLGIKDLAAIAEDTYTTDGTIIQLSGYARLERISLPEGAHLDVWRGPNNETIVAFRGTVLQDQKDFDNNQQILVGQVSDAAAAALTWVQNNIPDNGAPIIFVGHSKGGITGTVYPLH
jgi:hypothetical protein